MAHALKNVLDAAEQLGDQPNLRFLLVGAGAERDMLVADAAARKLENVVLKPAQPKERMPAVWSLCDVALVHLKDSPVFSGVIPSKLFEAMSMGLPLLLAAPSGEASAIIEKHGAGLCVAAERPEALAGAVRKFLGDENLRTQLGEASFRAAPEYSRERQAEETLRVFDSVRGGTSRSDPTIAV